MQPIVADTDEHHGHDFYGYGSHAAVSSGPAGAERYTINHYKIWKVKPVLLEKTVDLRGQFDKSTGGFSAVTRQIEYIGNPVRKNDEDGSITRPDWLW